MHEPAHGPRTSAEHGEDHRPDHDHHHHRHGHAHAHAASRWLPLALAITLGFAAVEALAGWWSGSLALLADAGHMLTDALALGLAALAARLARTPASNRHSYGLRRLEALAALTNGLFMLGLVVLLGWHAVERLSAPREVAGGVVVGVALVGLAINLAVAWLLTRGETDLNTRGALIHVLGDALGSVAALISGVVIQLTGWMPIDPLLTMLIGGLILASTLALLRQVVHTLLEGVPDGLSLQQVGHSMAATPGVHSVHDLHIWSLDSRHPALSAHVLVRRAQDWPAVLAALRHLLQERYGIAHVTLQPELPRDEPLLFAPRRSRQRPNHP
jgi:cobalt-zinc-cadmium efflux system protein